MKKEFLRFTLYAIIIYLICGTLNPAVAATHPLARNGTHFCGVSDGWANKRHSDQYPNRNYARTTAANLNVGEPRTVRMIYFLPNDRPYSADVVQRMKDEILNIQTFYAEQMDAHGYGRRTFRVETDPQGAPKVHRMDGKHPDSYYLDDTSTTVRDEVEEAFDLNANVYLIVIDNSINAIGLADGRVVSGVGGRDEKNGGGAWVDGGFSFETAAHELGHAFGLQHDFRDGAYVMSYGGHRALWRVEDRLSACSAEYLSVHPYFNPNIPIEMEESPTIELISPRSYPASSQSLPVRLRVSDPDGLHQVILHAAQPDNRWSVKSCRGFSGEKSAIIEFDYDGVIPSAHQPSYSIRTSLLDPLIHPIVIEAVDVNGDVDSSMWGGGFRFVLLSETLQPLTKISGDNQHGLPNTPLPVPFVVELRDLNDGFARREVPITFTVTVGGGTLSVTSTMTDEKGRAESTLTLGPNFGTNIVEVYTEGHTVTFNAVAGAPADIPDANLRAAIEDALNKAPGTLIAPAEIATMNHLNASNANISDLTGLETATNLTNLFLDAESIENRNINSNSVSDLSPLSGLTNLDYLGLSNNNISDLSGLSGLTKLRELSLGNNNISDLSPVAGLTNLSLLSLGNNNISDLSPVAGLTNLSLLILSNNNISDLSPLVANTGLGSGDIVDVRGNPLNRASIKTHIPALQSRGVAVWFDDRTPTILLNVSGVITASNNVIIVEVRDSNGRVLEGVPVTFTVTSGGGTLSVTSAITDEKGRAQSTLTLGPDGGTNIVRASVEGISESVTFSDVQANIPDSNLRAAIEGALGKKEGVPIAPGEMAALTRLEAPNANITDLTGLEFATNLTYLDLGFDTEGRRINSNSVSNLSPLVGLTQLTYLNLWGNSISDISPLAGLTKLTQLELSDNSISDISSVAGLTNLTYLDLDGNSISDISGVSELTNLTRLELGGSGGSNLSDLSPLANLTNLTILWLYGNNISDLSSLIDNTGLGSGDKVYVQSNPLSYQSIHTHIPTLQSRGVTVEFDNRAHPALLKISGDNQNGASFVSLSQPFVVEAQDAKGSALGGISVTFAVVAGGGTLSTTSTRTGPNGRAQSTLILGPNLGANTVSVSATGIESPATFYAIADTLPTEFLWSIPPGISLIHVPLRVTAIKGVETTVASISELYDVLGGANAVQFLITYDSQAQDWRSYFGASDTSADVRLANDTGIIANLKASASLHLSGTPLRTGGSGAINLNQGFNLVGLPLRDPRIQRVSDLLTLEEIGGNVPVIILTDGDTFTLVGRAGDPGDIAITGGQGFIMTAQRAATVTLSGDGWYNAADPSAAPQVALKGIEVKHTTPVLALRGAVVDKGAGLKVPTFRVTVKNLSTGRAVATAATPDGAGYQLTVVDIETGRAATVGDLLEIVAKSPDPSVGIQPLRYTVTAEDVKRSYIQLPALVAYEIPAETELLSNYPNPFNPETWIPYRLAEDTFVTLTIYDGSGKVVRALDVGHRIAAVYENRSKAIYWDGRNDVGERVASGVYFYHLSAGDYSATRRMVILK